MLNTIMKMPKKRTIPRSVDILSQASCECCTSKFALTLKPTINSTSTVVTNPLTLKSETIVNDTNANNRTLNAESILDAVLHPTVLQAIVNVLHTS